MNAEGKGHSTWAEVKAKRRAMGPVDDARIAEIEAEMIAAEDPSA